MGMSGVDPLGDRLRAERRARGLSQQDVATSAGVTQPYISRLERNDTNVELAGFRRVASAVGLRLTLEAAHTPPMVSEPYGEDEIANRQYLIGRLAAKRLTAQRIAQFRVWLELARERLGDYSYFRRWLEIIAEGPSAIEATMTDATEFGRYMRSVATLRPFVSQQERDSFYRPEPPSTTE